MITRSVNEVGADSRLNSSLAFWVPIAVASVFRKVTIMANERTLLLAQAAKSRQELAHLTCRVRVALLASLFDSDAQDVAGFGDSILLR